MLESTTGATESYPCLNLLVILYFKNLSNLNYFEILIISFIIGKTQYKPIYALAVHGFVISHMGLGLMVSTVGVYLNLDPFWVLPAIFDRSWAYPEYFKILRYFLVTYLVQIFLNVYTTIVLLTFLEGWFRIKILKLCINTFPSRFYRSLYTESSVMMKALFDFEYTTASLTYSGFFGGLLLIVYIILLGLQNNYLHIALLFLAILILGLTILYTSFVIAGIYFSVSNNVLVGWKRYLCVVPKGKSFQEVRRIVKSIQRISVPAGSAGKIDDEIQANYLSRLLNKTVDIIVSKGALNN